MKSILGICRRMAFYAVANGKQPGIYNNWDDCAIQVKGYKNAKFKKFRSIQEAEAFLNIFSESQNVAECVKPGASNSSVKRPFEPQPGISPKKLKLEEKVTDATNPKYVCLLDFHFVEPEEVRKKLTCPLNYDRDGFVQVYTDGACSNNGSTQPRAGIGVWFKDDHPLNVSCPVKGRQTNNTAEIQAATYALEICKALGITKVCVNTDSMFLINSMTDWRIGWKKKNWKLSGGGPVKNREDFELFEKAEKNMDIRWNHVKGHSGIKGNDEADKLARLGAS